MPYVLLALCGLLAAAWTIFRRHDAALVATAFTAATFVDLADWIGYSLLNLYRYDPGLSPDTVVDESLGVLLAEFIFVSSLTVVLVGHRPRWFWVALGAAVVTMLQETFTVTGLLVLNGWTWWLNAMGFLIYFWLMDSFYRALQRRGPGHGWLHVAAQVGEVGMFTALYTLIVKMTQAYVVYISLFPTHAQNQSFGRLILNLVVLLPLGLWVLRSSWRNPSGRIVAATLGAVLMDYLGVSIHLLRYRPPWNPVVDGLMLGMSLAAAALVDAWVGAWRESSQAVRTSP